ncbi:MAG: hypothetical protein IPH10_10730 [bacterium]|nr:hypothetical protein [bacterium]
MFQMTATELLVKILSGEIDPRALAAEEMANRGLDATGKWVGLKRASEIYGYGGGEI